jgi:hypothetical protein
MATYSFISLSDTIIKVTEDSTEILYKKVYCTTSVNGDYFNFFAHELETGKLRQQYSLLYTDCTLPAAASAAALKVAVDAIINAYAGGGGGGGTFTSGTFTVDFGGGSSHEIKTIVEAAVTGTELINFTPNDRIEDFVVEGIQVTLTSVTPSTGFNVSVLAPNNTSGIYTINYIIIN